jgi:hypothetical protein
MLLAALAEADAVVAADAQVDLGGDGSLRGVARPKPARYFFESVHAL